MIKKILSKLFAVLALGLVLALPLKAMEQESFEQQIIETLINTTIMAFEQPQTQQVLSQFSELVKDEHTYQFIIQKIDKFILTNELDEYEEQAEALKAAVTEMRELYIRSEKKALEQYNDMKKQQQEREKQRELKANHVIEV